jgi:hypothetical protein
VRHRLGLCKGFGPSAPASSPTLGPARLMRLAVGEALRESRLGSILSQGIELIICL